ncbi:MAG: hypothetical protein U0324_21950 [Polyangiales bacterium]
MLTALACVIAPGLAASALAGAALARRVARSTPSRALRGWGAAAGVALAGAVAPWALAGAVLRWEPAFVTAQREVVRVEAPSPEQMRSLVGEPRDHGCVREATLWDHQGHQSPHSHGGSSGATYRCGIARLEGSFNSSGGDYGSSSSEGWVREGWSCDSHSNRDHTDGSYLSVVRGLRTRTSRDGRFVEFTCPLVRCNSSREGDCRDPLVTASPAPLYVAEVPVALRELVRREGPGPLLHLGPLTSALAAAAALALAGLVRLTGRPPAASLPAAYRAPQPDGSPAPERRLRRALVAVTVAYGAAAVASWAVVLCAFAA